MSSRPLPVHIAPERATICQRLGNALVADVHDMSDTVHAVGDSRAVVTIRVELAPATRVVVTITKLSDVTKFFSANYAIHAIGSLMACA